MLRLMLEIAGFRVIEAPDGKAAWDEIVRHHPAVVVADVRMPQITGLDLCRKIKAEADHVCVVVFTAGVASHEEAKNAGADRYFLKTAPLNELREAMISLHSRGCD